MFRAPHHPALKPLVVSMWAFEADPGRPFQHHFEDILPSGRVQLLINLQEARLCDYTPDLKERNRAGGAGFTFALERPQRIDVAQQHHVLGVTFRPGGVSAFIDTPQNRLPTVVDAADLWGTRFARELRERAGNAPHASACLQILEDALLKQWRPPDVRVAFARARIEGGDKVVDVQRALGMSAPTLQRWFRAHFGVSPKTLSRLYRFQGLLARRPTYESWADAAYGEGYSDQSHLVRDFHRFAEVTPGRYRARNAVDVNHRPLDAFA